MTASGMDLSQGYVIEIRVSSDNDIKIGVEPLAEVENPRDDEDFEAVPALSDAIRIIRDIYTHSGDIDNLSQQMSAGYGDHK